MGKKNAISYVVTPGGEELAVLPRADLEAIMDTAARLREVSDYQAGRLPGLTGEEVLEFANASSPLAFWRKRAGMSQQQLADAAGIAQNYLSDIENGKRAGPVHIWVKLAAALDLPIDAIIDEE